MTQGTQLYYIPVGMKYLQPSSVTPILTKHGVVSFINIRSINSDCIKGVRNIAVRIDKEYKWDSSALIAKLTDIFSYKRPTTPAQAQPSTTTTAPITTTSELPALPALTLPLNVPSKRKYVRKSSIIK